MNRKQGTVELDTKLLGWTSLSFFCFSSLSLRGYREMQSCGLFLHRRCVTGFTVCWKPCSCHVVQKGAVVALILAASGQGVLRGFWRCAKARSLFVEGDAGFHRKSWRFTSRRHHRLNSFRCWPSRPRRRFFWRCIFSPGCWRNFRSYTMLLSPRTHGSFWFWVTALSKTWVVGNSGCLLATNFGYLACEQSVLVWRKRRAVALEVLNSKTDWKLHCSSLPTLFQFL